MNPPTALTAVTLIDLLGLEPHPEGGWYSQTWRDDTSTAIWFLVEADQRSHWHRVHGGVEIWHFHRGDPLELAISDDGIDVRRAVLGIDIVAGERPQLIVPAGAWQATTPIPGGSTGFTLVGCTVSPPFRFETFELAPPGWAPGNSEEG